MKDGKPWDWTRSCLAMDGPTMIAYATSVERRNPACGTDAAKTCPAVEGEEAVCTTIDIDDMMNGKKLQWKDRCVPKTMCKNCMFLGGLVAHTCGSAKLMYAAAAAVATVSFM